MLETSKDLFYVVLAVSVLWLSLFLGWFLYYLIKTLRSLYKIVDKAVATVEKADSLVEEIKEKLKQSSTYFNLLFELIKGFSREKTKRVAKPKSSKKTKN